MNNKLWLGLGGALLIIAVAVAIIATRPSDLTDEQIMQKFDCHRVTADYRPTDAYCSNPSLYREHLNNGISN